MAHPTESSPFKGDGLRGTGRACSGYLRITPEFIHWDTGIYACKNIRYKTLESRKAGSDFHAVYKLLNRPAKCPFEILTLDYTEQFVEGIGKGWNLTGYTTYKAWKKKDWGVDCGLY